MFAVETQVSPLAGPGSTESLLGLSHCLFSKDFTSPMFTFSLAAEVAKLSLNKKKVIDLVEQWKSFF